MPEENLNPTQTEPTPAANTPEARTPTGEIKDTTLNAPAAEPSSTATAPITPAEPPVYSAFTAPEGHTLSDEVLAGATPLFQELGLNQEQAQKLVDFYSTQMIAHNSAVESTMAATREAWVSEVRADPDIGPKLDSHVKPEIGRALQSLGDAKLIEGFKSAMDLTGAGDNPAFIKTFYKIAQRLNEGTHVAGGGPSSAGQARPGASAKPSAASAMYPSLPHS